MPDDILTHTLRAVELRLLAQGAPRTSIAPVLADVDAEVRALYGHARVYIPARGHGRRARDVALCDEYASGHTIPRLAARYEISEKQVRRILALYPAISHYTATRSA